MLRVLRRLAPRFPAPLLAVVIGIGLGAVFDLQGHGVRMVGAISGAVPTVALASAAECGAGDLLLTSFSVLLVSFGAGIITARSFGARYHVPRRRQLASSSGSAPRTSRPACSAPFRSPARSPHRRELPGRREDAGRWAVRSHRADRDHRCSPAGSWPICRSRPWGRSSASAAVDLVDVPRLAHAVADQPLVEFCLAIVALVGVAVFGALQGTALAVGASLVHLLWLGSRPRDALLAAASGKPELYKLHHHADAEPVPGFSSICSKARWCSSTPTHVKGRMLELVDGAQAGDWSSSWTGARSTISTAVPVEALEDVHAELSRRGSSSRVADLHRLPRGAMERSGLADRIGASMFFHSARKSGGPHSSSR